MLASKFCVVVNKCPMFNREQMPNIQLEFAFSRLLRSLRCYNSRFMLCSPMFVRKLACEHADAHAVIVPLCSLTKGALRRKYTLNLKMFFLLIRESTIICSQYLVSVTLNYDIRAFNVCRLEERELLSACLASCVLSNI